METSFSIEHAFFFINKNAGNKRNVTSLLAFLKKHNISHSCTENKEEFEIVFQKLFDKYTIFVAVGGDGTFHSLAKKIVGTEKIIGVVPYGSGNAFAREMGFLKNISPLISAIKKKSYRKVDCLKINEEYIFNVGGTGLDSIVAHAFEKTKKRGFWGYALLIFRLIWKFKPFKITITREGKQLVSTHVFILDVANNRQYGNNAYISPQSIPDDGTFEIVIVRPFPRWEIPFFIFQLFTKRLKNSKYTEYIPSKKACNIISENNMYHADGEPFVLKEVTISLERQALNIIDVR